MNPTLRISEGILICQSNILCPICLMMTQNEDVLGKGKLFSYSLSKKMTVSNL